MDALLSAGVSFLVGGAFALRTHAGIERDTRDFDVMVRRGDLPAALRALTAAGFRAEVVFPHWIAKAYHGGFYLDLIYNSGNGLCPVDDEWFAHARPAEVLGRRVPLCPPEEIIWQKAYIMERERFDGADIAHILHHCRGAIDWDRLRRRFGADGPVLLAHLLLTRFVYPGVDDIVPESVLAQLFALEPERGNLRRCNGPLLSRAQYLVDLRDRGLLDARRERGAISAEDLRVWTAAIPPEASPRG